MANVDRRTFLQMAAAAAVPLPFERALSIPAHDRHGSIEDVEHVIFLMQENRSFDHYFGTMRGVRGYADPHPVNLPSGQSVFHQAGPDGVVLPFRPDVRDLGRTFLPDTPHGWNDTHGAWNGGRYDGWVPNKGVTTMTHHTRADLPYQYALADAFTVCDNYHCSLLGPTDPNRYHMWTGWVGNDGKEVPVAPADGRLPAQERGVRPARALPYALHADARPSTGALAVDFRNLGAATGVYQVRSADPAMPPRSYTVEPAKQVTDVWPADTGYDLSVHGPNGFYRRFAAGARHPGVVAQARYDARHQSLALELTNRGDTRAELAIADRYSGRHSRVSLRPGETRTEDFGLSKSHGWYGVTVTLAADQHFAVEYAGHLEDGEPSVSDPAMGGLV